MSDESVVPSLIDDDGTQVVFSFIRALTDSDRGEMYAVVAQAEDDRTQRAVLDDLRNRVLAEVDALKHEQSRLTESAAIATPWLKNYQDRCVRYGRASEEDFSDRREGLPVVEITKKCGALAELPPMPSPLTTMSTERRVDDVFWKCKTWGSILSGAKGGVVVSFAVGSDGRANDVRVLKSAGSEKLDKQAICIVQNLQFQPTEATVYQAFTVGQMASSLREAPACGPRLSIGTDV